MFKKGITRMKIFYKTLLGETGFSRNPYFLTGCLSIHFCDSRSFSPAPVWLGGLHAMPLVTKCFSLNSPAPVWLTRLHATPLVAKCFSLNPLPREEEDFPRGGNHSKHEPLPTYLAWLQLSYYDLGFVFIHGKLRIFLLVEKTVINNIEQQPH